MAEWETETHATTTVSRSEDGTIQYIKCRAEYFEAGEDENGEEVFTEGVNAKFRFHVVDGEIAHLVGVKDIADDAPGGYETSLDFVRAIPVAEKAVWNVPGIEEVQSTEAYIQEELDRGRTAIQ